MVTCTRDYEAGNALLECCHSVHQRNWIVRELQTSRIFSLPCHPFNYISSHIASHTFEGSIRSAVPVGSKTSTLPEVDSWGENTGGHWFLLPTEMELINTKRMQTNVGEVKKI